MSVWCQQATFELNGYLLCNAAAAGAVFAYITGSSLFFINALGLSAEAGQKRFGLHAHGGRVGVSAGVADPGAADDLLRHDRLEADPEMPLLRDAVGVFGHEPEHALGAAIAARHRRTVYGRAARSHQDAAAGLERQV